MPLDCLDPSTGRPRARYAASPVLAVLAPGSGPLAALPAPVRAAADHYWLNAVSAARAAGATFAWRPGDRLLQGTAAQIRHALRAPAQRVFFPVHFPLAAHDDDNFLIALEPRGQTPLAGARERTDTICPAIRIAAASVDAGGSDRDEPWAVLAALAGAAAGAPASAVPPLAAFAAREDLHPVLQALGLRNLIVILLHTRQWDDAARLLAHARSLHPGYRELDYQAAKLAIARGRLTEAIAALQLATQPADVSAAAFIGSCGESSYRAHALLAFLADGTGSQAVAVHHYLSGVRHAPAYPPAVAGLLRQRLPRSSFAAVQWELSHLGRREPGYQSAIFDFFLLHRWFAEARRLLTTWPLADDARARYRARLEALAPLYRPTPRSASARPGVVLQGPLLMHASVAAINRQLAGALESDANFDVAIEPTLAAELPPSALPAPARWSEGLRRLPRRLDLTIRHGWPPDFSPPPTGRMALILPWEFGSVPRSWLPGLAGVDEVWAPSGFVRDVLVRAGVEAAKIAVIPNGVDLDRFTRRGERFRPAGSRAFSFLFSGGIIRRKGFDVLLRAWREAFSSSDDVSLTVKAIGARSFYRHLSLREEVVALASDPGAAPVILIEEEWGEERMPALYRGCDCLALPYRGEGFGLPLAEAMACGKPVITTGLGPAREFCPPAASWLLPAAEVEVPEALRPPEATVAPLTWFEPSLAALVAALRAAAADPAGCAERGAVAASAMRRSHGWDAITAQYRQRALLLTAAPGVTQ